MRQIENLESRTHFSGGGIDNTFGTSGEISMPIGNYPTLYSGITVLPNGKFIVAGGSRNGSTESASMMVRYLADGSIDNSFGSHGKVLLSLDGKAVTVDAVAAAPNGGLVLLETAANGKEFLTRYSANGSRNTQFGLGGKAQMSAGVTAAQITFDGKGNLVLGAYYSPPLRNGELAIDAIDSLALLRYSAGGKRDAHFGHGGLVITDFHITTWTPNIEPLADGKIMAISQEGLLTQADLLRFNADGSLDTSYGTSGSTDVSPPLSETTGYLVGGIDFVQISTTVQAISAQFQPDGSVIVAYTDGQTDPLRLAHFTAAGTLDTSFGTQGLATVPFTNNPVGVFRETNGEYLVVANTFRTDVGQNEYDNVGIAELTANGLLDANFGTNGIASNDNSPAIGVGAAAVDGSRLLVEPDQVSPSKLAVTAYST